MLNVPRINPTAIFIGSTLYVYGGIGADGHLVNSFEMIEVSQDQTHFSSLIYQPELNFTLPWDP